MFIKLTNIVVLFLALVLSACSDAKPDQTNPEAYALNVAKDVDYLCNLVPNKYAYYQSKKPSWAEACEQAKVEALAIVNKQDGLAIFERLMDALYDSHVSLGTNSGQSPRLIPSGSDIWAKWSGSNLRVIAVRNNGGAAQAGVLVGDIITQFHGQKPKYAALERIRTDSENISDERMNWATNAAIAGYRYIERTIIVQRENQTITYELGEPSRASNLPPITSRIIASNIGYIRFNNSLGNSDTVMAFDQALENMKGVDAWIIDLRDTPGGGNTDVAEPILGRFIESRKDYQQIVELNKKPYNRKVHSQGPWTVKEPVIILVGRWTGSMGEGMAVGFDGMNRGLVIGSAMAGLAGGTDNFTLPKTNIPVRFPTYDLSHIDGTPRHEWKPPIQIAADDGSENDTALQRAVAELSKTERNP